MFVLGQVLVIGIVFDEVSKVVVLVCLCEVYGVDCVVDQIVVGQVVLLVNWNNYVQKLILFNFKVVSCGQLKIDGISVSILGEVFNEVQCQQIVSDMVSSFNFFYMVNNGLCVFMLEQGLLDNVLVNWVVFFESGQVMFMLEGKCIFDEIVVIMFKFKGWYVEIIGNIDNEGLCVSNILLLLVWVDVVKVYFSVKGVDESLLMILGQGLDCLVVFNNMVEGCVKN